MTSKFLEPQGSFFIIKMPKQIKKVNLCSSTMIFFFNIAKIVSGKIPIYKKVSKGYRKEKSCFHYLNKRRMT